MILIQYYFSFINTKAKPDQPNRICRILIPLNYHQQSELPVTLNIIAQMVYTTTMNKTYVHTRLHQESYEILSWTTHNHIVARYIISITTKDY